MQLCCQSDIADTSYIYLMTRRHCLHRKMSVRLFHPRQKDIIAPKPGQAEGKKEGRSDEADTGQDGGGAELGCH